MEKYENIEIVGEGSYGVVMKCKHKETGQIVAVKKFLESMDNVYVRRLAFREIRMLKRLRHENLVSLIEVFRRRKRFYLVFEYLDHTILDELEAIDGGLGFELARRHIFQVLRGLNFCHNNHIIHRDVKPENVLVSTRGVVKLCDFGFARIVTGANESCTDYVATRWYRAPELLVGDSRYGRPVDIWATGCLFAEMLTGDPLFPGDSDLDQLFRIIKTIGYLCARHQNLVHRGSNLRLLHKANVTVGWSGALRSLRALLPGCGNVSLDFLVQCLRMDPEMRPSGASLLQHALFHQNCFAERFLVELGEHVAEEIRDKPLLRSTRDECRRCSVLSLDEPKRNYGGEAMRWQMKLIRDSVINTQKPQEAAPAVGRSRSRMLVEGDQQYLRHPRGLYFSGPVNVATNATYIRRLEHRALLKTGEARNDEGDLVLPALASRDRQQQRRKPPVPRGRGSICRRRRSRDELFGLTNNRDLDPFLFGSTIVAWEGTSIPGGEVGQSDLIDRPNWTDYARHASKKP